MKRTADERTGIDDDPTKRLRIVPAGLAREHQPTAGPAAPAAGATAPAANPAAPDAAAAQMAAYAPQAGYAPPAGYAPQAAYSAGSPSFSLMGPMTQNEFNMIFQCGKCAMADIDDSVYKSLADFHDITSQEIASGFGRADLSSVRNKTGFIIGILKNYRKKGIGLKRGGPPPQPAGVYGAYAAPQQAYYGSYDPYGQQAAAPAAPADLNAPAAPADLNAPAAAAADPNAAAQQAYDPAAYAQYAQAYPGYDPNMAAYYGQMDPAYGGQQYYDPNQAYAQAPAAGGPAPQRSKGSGLAGLSQPIQDLFQQIFAVGMVTADDVPASIYDSLVDFDEDTQWAIVERFSKADLGRVRNKTGYLIGILKIARQGKASGHGFGASAGGGGGGAMAAYGATPAASYAPMTSSPAYSRLCSYVQNRLGEMTSRGEIQEGDLDHGVFDSLAAFDEASQVEIVDIFASKDLHSIRNKTGFFIGILKKQRVLKQNQDMVSQWQ